MSQVEAALRRAVGSALDRIGAGGVVEVVVEPSARPEFGDWSTPAPLGAASVLRRSPMAIAEDLRTLLEEAKVQHVAGWSVTAPGYVNARLDDASWAPAVIDTALALDPSRPLIPDGGLTVAGRTLIEHTNINTNKAAHVGHLRNACLGDTVARILRRTGHDVEVNNYIDDTGVQVADVVVGLQHLGLTPRENEPFDQFCSRVYVEVSRRYESDPALVELRARVLRDIEARDNDTARFAKEMASRVVGAQLATMRRFDIAYDLLTWESDILELGFWDRAFELLRGAGAIVLAQEGKNAGCWVMPEASGNEVAAEEEDAKVLVKSDGVATYTAKDIAYQLWKFGLLGLDFKYRRWDEGDGPVTTTAAGGDEDIDGSRFGRAQRVVNVIDARQASLQRVVQQALARLGYTEQAERSVHLAYEVVALSATAASQLGMEVEEGRTLYAFSGRRGIEVRADDLLDVAVAQLRDKARDERAARALAAGAIRYYLQKFSLTQIIAFDFREALRVTGDTGVYLQYAHARAAGILRKVPGAGAGTPAPPPAGLVPQERALLFRIDGYRSALAEAAAALSPAVLAAYAFDLASALSDFYEHTPVIVRETDPALRRFRRALVAAAKSTLGDALAALGMEAPEHV